MITKKANLIRVLKNINFTKNEPISVVHFLTNRCNARCSFCFIDFDDPNTFKGELTLEEIEKLTKSFGKSLLNVNLTGGEPFARKDIIDIAKLYISNSTIQSIYVTTNASLPDRIENFVKEITNFKDSIEGAGMIYPIIYTDLEHYWLKEKRWPKDKDGNCIPGLAVHTGNKRVYWAKQNGYTHIEGYYVTNIEEQKAIVKQTFIVKESYPNV